MIQPPAGRSGWWDEPGRLWTTLALCAPVFLAALATRVGLIGYAPIYDELYQVLPAQSYWRSGDYAVLDGVYDRAAIFTRLIAFSFDLFGESGVTPARLIPSAIPGALLVALIFGWTRMVVGVAAGWFAAVFMLLWPNGIEVSQYIRFYALQGLAFAIGALATYAALEGARALRWRFLWGGVAAVAFAIALKLQLLTVIGGLGIALWIAIAHLPGWLRTEPRLWLALAAGVAGVAAVLASGVFADTLRWAWTTYNWAPWPALEDKFFYHRNFRDNYPTFWPLFPVAALIALAVRPRVAIFCLSIFTVSFLLQSFGGLKNIRYLYPTMPFFFVLWAAALQAATPAIFGWLRRTGEGALGPYAPRAAIGVAATVCVAGSAVFLFAANAAFERSSRLVMGEPRGELLGKIRWTWPDAPELMRSWLEDGAIIITSEEMKAVEYLGDFDLAYNKPRFSELLYSIGPDTPPFTPDGRTGRPIFGEIDELRRVVECAPVGVFIANRNLLGRGVAFQLTLAAQNAGAVVETEAKGGFALIGWRRDGAVRDDLACEEIIPPEDDRAATRLLSGERGPVHVSSSANAER